MKPRLALIPAQLNGFLKVSATVGNPDVRLAAFNLPSNEHEMPVLQIEEAGIVVELEFLDVKGLEAFARRIAALVPKRKSKHA